MPAEAPPPLCLVVDDEPRLRQVLTHLMRSSGFRCTEAANGVEALERMADEPADLVVSDVRMPKMDGSELLRRLRERDVHSVIGGVAGNNAASIALHVSFGFEQVAHFRDVGHKFGRWIDVTYFQLLF